MDRPPSAPPPLPPQAQHFWPSAMAATSAVRP